MAKRRSTRRRTRRAAPKTRTVYRTRSTRRARRSSGGRAGGWIPLSTKEMVTSFAVGAISPTVNSYVAPYTDGFLEMFGNYKDEARTALIGVAAYKLGSGMVKDAGREMFRYAVLSAGQETGSRFFNGTASATNNGGW